MDKSDRRKTRGQSKVTAIMRGALELFAIYGFDKVTMDEIAESAKVAKATLYKYFGSKEELYDGVVNMYIDEILAETEAIFHSDIDFLEKLRFVLINKSTFAQVATWEYLTRILSADRHLAEHAGQRIDAKMKALIRVFVDDGKAKGYIDESIPFEVFYLYSQVVRAGFQIKMPEIQSTLVDKETVDTLVHLYFFGILKSPPRNQDHG